MPNGAGDTWPREGEKREVRVTTKGRWEKVMEGERRREKREKVREGRGRFSLLFALTRGEASKSCNGFWCALAACYET